MDRYLGRYSCKTEDPSIVNLRDCSRGFHFCAIFHFAYLMPLVDRCSISRFSVVFMVVLATQLKLRYACSCQASIPFDDTVSYLQDHYSIYDLFKMLLFIYEVDGLNKSILSKI